MYLSVLMEQNRWADPLSVLYKAGNMCLRNDDINYVWHAGYIFTRLS